MGDPQHVKVAIIGSGPAGWTAAIYAARANLAPVMFEGSEPGGQLMITTEVENYPGFPEGIQGPELMRLFKEQAARFDTDIRSEMVNSVDLSKRPFHVKGESTEVLAEAIIISTGAAARYLGLPGEEDFHNKGLSACATCDGFFFRGKEVAVIGGGDSAVEEATFLTKFSPKVLLIHRRDELRASKIMQKRAFENEKVEIIWNKSLASYIPDGDGHIKGIELSDTQTGEATTLDVQGVFMAIGHTPNTQIFAGQLETDDGGYLITQADCTATSVEGVFACGDVQDTVYKQAITAAGSGCMAAIDVERWLESRVG